MATDTHREKLIDRFWMELPREKNPQFCAGQMYGGVLCRR